MPPHPSPRKPPLANLLKALLKRPRNTADAFNYLFSKKNTIVKMNILRNYYLVSDPELAHYILKNDAAAEAPFERCGPTMDRLALVFGDGLASKQGAFWQPLRQLLQTRFLPQENKTYFFTMQTLIKTYIDQNLKPITNTKKTLNIHKSMASLTLNIAAEIFFSITLTPNLNEKILKNVLFEQKFISNYYGSTTLPSYFRWKHRCIRQKFTQPLLKEIIKTRREEGTKKINDLLSYLLDAINPKTKKPYPDSVIEDQIINFLVTGHETSASILSWWFYEVGKNPPVYQKVKDEVSTVLKNTEMTLEDLKKLPYLRATIEEILRLYPSIWCIPRITKYPVQLGGYQLPAKATLFVNPYFFHRDEKHWKDPNLFRPERFLKPNTVFAANTKKHAYFPFGTGQHTCIGKYFALQEILLILGNILQQFDFSLENKAFPYLLPLITLRPRKKILISFSKNEK